MDVLTYKHDLWQSTSWVGRQSHVVREYLTAAQCIYLIFCGTEYSSVPISWNRERINEVHLSSV